MTHIYRFYTDEDTPQDGIVELSPEEGHHATQVARCSAGDPVILFDGLGHEWSAAVDTATKKRVTVRIETHRTVARPDSDVVLVQAYLNHEKALDETVRRCTELGVTGFAFFKGERSERVSRHGSKWNRFAVESCKQCGRAWLPSFEQYDGLASAMGAQQGRALLVATDARDPVPLETALGGRSSASVIVGPEGGLSAAEVDQALDSGALPISLGATVLRSELAAPVACALILYSQGELGPLPEESKRKELGEQR